jgi:4-oxalocrotonate tautomerase
MSIVTFQLTREGSSSGAGLVTVEEKARLAEGVSELLRDVLGMPMQATFVVIRDGPGENWGRGCRPVEQYRAQRRAAG